MNTSIYLYTCNICMFCTNIRPPFPKTKPQFWQYRCSSLDSAKVPLASLLGSTMDCCWDPFRFTDKFGSSMKWNIWGTFTKQQLTGWESRKKFMSYNYKMLCIFFKMVLWSLLYFLLITGWIYHLRPRKVMQIKQEGKTSYFDGPCHSIWIQLDMTWVTSVNSFI